MATTRPLSEILPKEMTELKVRPIFTLLLEVRGTKSLPKLAARIAEIPGVVSVQAGDAVSE